MRQRPRLGFSIIHQNLPIVKLRLFRDEMERMIREFDEFEKEYGEEGPEE